MKKAQSETESEFESEELGEREESKEKERVGKVVEPSEVVKGDFIEEMKVLQEQIEKKEREAEEYLLLAKRVQAEFENYKKRAERERAEYTEQANARLILTLLPVLDNFERALNVENSDMNSFKKGLTMIFSQLKSVLETEGLSAIEAVGKEFDPYYHEAVLTAVGDYEEDIILEEYEKGYLFKTRVLRPSKVKVGKR